MAAVDEGIARLDAPALVAGLLDQLDRGGERGAQVEVDLLEAGRTAGLFDGLQQAAREALAARPGRHEKGGELRGRVRGLVVRRGRPQFGRASGGGRGGREGLHWGGA